MGSITLPAAVILFPMDIYAKAKYNRPAELSEVVNGAMKPNSDSDES